jgi:hypothetical protein
MSSHNNIQGHAPLVEYPWCHEIDRILESSIGKNPAYSPFLFDCVMSLTYIDATAGLEKAVEFCHNCGENFNAHIGFTNLCATCYRNNKWKFQKAAKPQSGALGKLSSEVILKFIEHLSPSFKKVLAIGGSGYADALIEHSSGISILAEVKSAPLLTYSLLLCVKSITETRHHEKASLTFSQLRECDSGLNMHGGLAIPLGKVGSVKWPFKKFADFVEEKANLPVMEACLAEWNSAREAYIKKDKNNVLYYMTNACGSPPLAAKRDHGWPNNEVISDGKTSAGMDRTDDIKKGIYQTLKIGITHKNQSNYKSALISNLPAYRHGSDYVDPITPLLWGLEDDLETINELKVIQRKNLRYAFDYIITLESPLMRDLII